MIDSSIARRQMVVHQIQARGITSAAVIRAMNEVPREEFLGSDMREFAYEDSPLPIGSGQTISQPYIVAYMIDALDLEGGERVLEVGTGSGYAAANHRRRTPACRCRGIPRAELRSWRGSRRPR